MHQIIMSCFESILPKDFQITNSDERTGRIVKIRYDLKTEIKTVLNKSLYVFNLSNKLD